MRRLFLSGPREAESAVQPGESLVTTVRAVHPAADLQPIRSAYDVAVRWHAGQKRYSGDPYVTHPLAVATIVAELGFGPAVVCAALLHDVVEDTPYTLAQMRAEFGDEVTTLVERLPNRHELHRALALQQAAQDLRDAGNRGGETRTLEQAAQGPPQATIDGELAATASPRDVELLVVKLADRLHNMRTVRHVRVATQIRVSRETLAIAAPLAHLLGLSEVKRELEDLAIGVLRPVAVSDRPTLASLQLLRLTGLLLPRGARARWREEWAAEVGALRTSRQRVRFVLRTLVGVPGLAVTLSRAGSGEGPLWTVHLARIAQALGIGGAIVAITAQGEVFAWIVGAFALAALGLLGALLFARNGAPASRLADLIRAWRR